MFPLRDNIPSSHKPFMVWSILGLNALVFLLELGFSDVGLAKLFHTFGVVPARFTHAEWANWMGYPSGGEISFLTHMFLHAGWLHVIGNMWMLWVFADNVEDVMGSGRFLVFYLLSGLAALGVHFAFNLDSAVPVVGASGAIAGVLGAYFLLYPQAKVRTLVPLFIIPYYFDIPAVVFLGIWFVTQVFSGLATQAQNVAGAGIAWWAHVGGFLAGMLLMPVFRDQKRCVYCGERSNLP